MGVLENLLFKASMTHDLFVLSLVVALGIVLGHVRFFNVRLGVAGVLFAGLLFGHFGIKLNHEVLEFTRELGLILFVFTIGLHVGPAFFRSLRKQGLVLNLLAALAVLGAVAFVVFYAVMGWVEPPVAVGLFSGATTNTPSLGAAQAALSLLPDVTDTMLKQPGMAYAMAYPFGIMGIILVMLLVRLFFRITVAREASSYDEMHKDSVSHLVSVSVAVENPSLEGLKIREVPFLKSNRVVLSRLMHGDRVLSVSGDSVLSLGDIVHLVGPKEAVREVQLLFGSVSPIDLRADVTSELNAKRIVVTKKGATGILLQTLVQRCSAEIAVTRLVRGGIEMPIASDMRLQLGDVILAVGDSDSLDDFRKIVGDSFSELDAPQLVSIFVGIALGLFLGSIPFTIPGLPYPVKLGLAGGPLVAAIILGWVGRIGKLNWYMTSGANLFVREFGIALFLACVGLKSGSGFWTTLSQGDGLLWMGLAALITFVPLMIVGIVGRAVFKLNYLALCGLLAGSMTDPPALAFANAQSDCKAASVSYATVYPLVMLLRIVAAQVLVLVLM